MVTCPKCNHLRSSNDDPTVPEYQCPNCGIIYKKYLAKLSEKFTDLPKSNKVDNNSVDKSVSLESGVDKVSKDKSNSGNYIQSISKSNSLKIITSSIVIVTLAYFILSQDKDINNSSRPLVGNIASEEEKITDTLQERNGLQYTVNEETPYTGKYISYWGVLSLNEEEVKVKGQKKEKTHYKYGMADGISTSWYANGQKKSEANFKEGKRYGLVIFWHENGQKKSEANFKEGKRDGLVPFWYANGQKEGDINYKGGEKDGLSTYWYANGQKEGDINYKEDKKDGLSTFWYENGERRMEVFFKEDKVNGLLTFWYKNGQKQMEVFFKENKKDGLSIYWDENGQKKGELNYNDGLTSLDEALQNPEVNNKILKIISEGKINGVSIVWDITEQEL